MLWLDVLDMPTVNHFETSFMEHFDEKAQNINRENGDSLERWGSGVLPDGETVTPFQKRSPVINYTYARTRPIAERLMKTGDIDPSHGARVRYSNPVNGEHVMPTMGAWLSMFPKGFKGKDYRSTDGMIFVCVEGHGSTKVEDEVMEWGPNDVFVDPAVEALFAQLPGAVGAVLDLRPAGAGAARHLARGALGPAPVGARRRKNSSPARKAGLSFAAPFALEGAGDIRRPRPGLRDR